jgi:L-aminopeptidase/D-esterase-like protein
MSKNKAIISKSKKNVEYNFKDIQISCVEYDGDFGSGMTLIYCPKYMPFYISKRGQDIGGFFLDHINREGFQGTKAICLVGGSGLGLEAVCGVNKSLLEENKFKYHDRALGVCCYTLNLLLYKKFIYPDIELGKYAFKNLNNNPIPIGQYGAGKNTAVAKIGLDWKKNYVKSGQGVHYLKIGKIKVLCIIVLNSIGLVHDKGRLLHEYKGYSELKDVKDLKKLNEFLKGRDSKIPSNTTLTAIITNVKLDEDEREKLGEQLHDVVQSMIYPYGTIYDGDTLFLASTKKVDLEDKAELYKIGKECIKKSIYSVFE